MTALERIDTSRQKSTRNAETQTISTLSDNRYEISRYRAQEIRTLNFHLSDKARSLSSTSDEIQRIQRDSVKGRDVQISDFEIHHGQDMEIHTGKVGNWGGDVEENVGSEGGGGRVGSGSEEGGGRVGGGKGVKVKREGGQGQKKQVVINTDRNTQSNGHLSKSKGKQ